MKSIRNQQALKLADANNGHDENVFALCSSKLWNTLLLDVQKSNTQTQRPNSRPSSSFCFQTLSFEKHLGHNGGCVCYTNVQELFRLF